LDVISEKELGCGFSAALEMAAAPAFGITRSTIYSVECRDAGGDIRWVENVHNLVTTVGLNDSLDKHFKGSSYTATWYVGLTNTTPTFAQADTASSHAGWTEFTTYSESVRQTLTLGTVAAGSVDNTASKAVFSVNGSGTVGGAFLISNSTKSGTTGILYGEAVLSANRAVVSGDTLTITVTLTAA